MILKRAIINLIRMPVRTVLLSSIIFITVFIICFCGKITRISKNALDELNRVYPFTATAVVKKIPASDGSISSSGRLNLDDAFILLQSEAVFSYNIRMAAGMLAEDEIISVLPDNTLLESDPAKELNLTEYPVYAVNNLYLEQEFLDGTYTICEGTAFTDADMYGGNRAIILSESIAARYHVSCGDTVNYRISNSRVYRSCIVRGIYRERSGKTVIAAYIPLSDYFNDTAIAQQGMSRADSKAFSERSLDAVNRIDILLASYDSMPQFLYDAKEHGFNFEKNDIIINDKAYNTASSGIGEIRNISMFVLCLTAITGVIIVYALTAFFRRTREKETVILHCLGMRYREIYAIYLCEYAIILVFLSAAAGFISNIASESVIQHLENTYVAEIEEYANQKETVSDTINRFQSSALSYPVKLCFRSDNETEALHFTEWKSVAPEQSVTVRYETFYEINSGRKIIVKGTDELETSTECGEEILYEANRISGPVFCCNVPRDSGYEIGDYIIVCRYAEEHLTMMAVDMQENCTYITPYMAYVTFQAEAFSDTDMIEVSFDDLTLITTYLGISSSIYRNIRYDSVSALEELYE